MRSGGGRARSWLSETQMLHLPVSDGKSHTACEAHLWSVVCAIVHRGLLDGILRVVAQGEPPQLDSRQAFSEQHAGVKRGEDPEREELSGAHQEEKIEVRG